MNRTIYFLGFGTEISESLVNLLEAIYGRKYTAVPINYVHDLKKIDSEEENVVILYIRDLNLEQRKFIWQFKINYPKVFLVLCSKDLPVANFAWQIQAVFFLPYPFSRRAVSLMFKKIEEKISVPKLKIKLNYQGGFNLVNSEDICFCEGDGNYTTIHLRNSKNVLLSKKIKDIYQKLLPFPEVIRIGKSYIINMENVIKVDDKRVYFKSQNTEGISFTLSAIYLKRLKEHLLMFST